MTAPSCPLTPSDSPTKLSPLTLRKGKRKPPSQAVNLKPKKHDFCEVPGKIWRFMSATGG